MNKNPFRLGDRVGHREDNNGDGTVVEIVNDESVRVYWRKPNLRIRQDTVMFVDELVTKKADDWVDPFTYENERKR